MSDQPFEVTARKYRPQTFSEVIGQDHITQTLQNALKTSQIAHAYLFAGPRGTGKTTVARLMAKALNCRSSDTMVTEPCDDCESCLAIARGSSIDVLEIDGASNRGIDQIRELRETVGYAAFEGRYKVYIIDEVHQLTDHAFNALLKTLEEPPKHVVFIFATTEPTSVIPTILSRVQRYDFRRIGIGAITDTLKIISQKEELSAEEEALHLIASKAEGALRDAESLLDQVRAFAGSEITLEVTRKVLGIVGSERLFALTRLSAEKDAAGALRLAAELIEEGQDPYEFLLGYADHLRFMIAAAIGGEVGLESLLDVEKKEYLETAKLLDMEDFLRRLEFISAAADTLRSSPQPWIALEAAFLRLVRMDSSVDLRELLDRLEGVLSGTSNPHNSAVPAVEPSVQSEQLEEHPGKSEHAAELPAEPERDEPVQTESGSVEEEQQQGESMAGVESSLKEEAPQLPEKEIQPARISDDPMLPPIDTYEEEAVAWPSRKRAVPETGGAAGDVTGVQKRWSEILEEVRRRKVTLGAFLSEAELLGVEDNKLVLSFRGENHNFHINMVNRHFDIIRDVTREILGQALGVKCLKADDRALPKSRGREKKKASDVNQQLLERLCEQDQDLKKIVDIFNAHLEDGPGGKPGF